MAKSNLLHTSINSDDTYRVGGIFDMDYSSALVQTSDDIKKNQCGGLPKHCYLVALPNSEDGPGDDLREHALLLRVVAPAKLPHEEQLREVRYQNVETQTSADVSGSSSQGIDPITTEQAQKTGVECDIVGTYYNGDEGYEFAEGTHTIFPSGGYEVYKPTGDSLRDLVSLLPQSYHPDEATHVSGGTRLTYETESGKDTLLSFGEIRYAAARLSESESNNPANVYVPVSDFVEETKGNKTGIIGMTRTGKSNTINLIASSVHLHAADVGQLIYDPSGEYAKPSDQTNVHLGALRDTVRYKYRPNDEEREAGFHAIENNLLDSENLDIAKREVMTLLREDETEYVGDFTAALRTKVKWPESNTELGRMKHIAAFYAVMIEGTGREMEADEDWDIKFDPRSPDTIVDEANSLSLSDKTDLGWGEVKYINDTDREDEDGYDLGIGYIEVGNGDKVKIWDEIGLVKFIRSLAENFSDLGYDENDDKHLHSILEMLVTSHTGAGKLRDLLQFHNPNASQQSEAAIYEQLAEGKLVIIDLSNGDSETVQSRARNYVEYTLRESERRFRTEGESPPRIQLYLEEAHRYFSEDEFESETQTPYVRLAKEGAKFNIGMVYATQEISSVEDEVLNNTANWVVTHLNNTNEIGDLSDYYDFEAFSEVTRQVSEVGFARLRTLSGKFTIPIKLHEFNREWVEELDPDALSTVHKGTSIQEEE